jgi:hypothetical protein
MEIGGFRADKIKGHAHVFELLKDYSGSGGSSFNAGAEKYSNGAGVMKNTWLEGDNESSPASISSYLCIKY